MVQDKDVETWFKMQVWMLQYLIRDFKESDGVIIDAHDPEVFKTRLLDEGWESDSNHVAFAPFATADFHIICKRYLEQTSSHLIGKLKSFVMARMSFGQACEEPTLKWTSTVESSWHELQGVKRFDPEAPVKKNPLSSGRALSSLQDKNHHHDRRRRQEDER